MWMWMCCSKEPERVREDALHEWIGGFGTVCCECRM